MWKQLKCLSVDKWIKKLWEIYGIYIMEYCSAIKRNEILPFPTTWMDLQGIMLSEISKIEEKQIPYDFTYMWDLKNK